MLAPNTIVRPFISPSCSQDYYFKHNEILQNPQFKSAILGILNGNSARPSLAAEKNSKPMSNESANFTSEDSMNYLNITGVNRLEITDENGNTNSPLGAMDTPIPGIDYEYGSNVGESLVFPHEVTFSSGKKVDVKFRTSTDKITIENIKGFGRENATEIIKYLDLQLPVGVNAWLKFKQPVIVDPPTSIADKAKLQTQSLSMEVENLRYDADGDGVYETEVQPTFYLTGASARDITPPNIEISFSVNNNVATVTVNATDTDTGINQIRYIVNGETSDHIYNSPFIVNLTQSKLIYVSAEDNAGNRNLLAKWLDVSSPNTTATQTPAPNTNGWSKTDVGVEIKAHDDLGGSGVESLTFSGNGAQTIPEEKLSVKEIPFTFPHPGTASDFLAKSLTINTEGITNLTFFAKDKAGNIEAAKTLAVKIDKTSPSSYHRHRTDLLIKATVTLVANDSLSGVDRILYTVDGGNLRDYNTPFGVSGLGNHVITYYSIDRAGNVEPTKSFIIFLPEIPSL